MGDTGFSHTMRALPDGSFQNVFDGGAELPVNRDVNAPVRWVRTTDGALVATLAANETYAQGGGPALATRAALTVYGADDPSRQAGVSATVGNITGIEGVEAFAGGERRTVLNSDGFSDFWQRELTSHGTGEIYFDGSEFYGTVEIPHGLPDGPPIVLMTGRNTGSLFYSVTALGMESASFHSVTYAAQIFDLEEPVQGTYQFSWFCAF